MPAPADLGSPYAELWDELAGHQSLDSGPTAMDRLILGALVACTRRLNEVSALLDDAEKVVVGSTGQPKEHPLITVEAALRKEQAERLARWETRCRGW